MSAKIKAVVFDLDGTLLDTLADIATAVNSVLSRHGLKCRTLAEFRQFLGHGSKYLIEQALGPDHQDIFAEVFAEYKAEYAANLAVFSRPYHGIPELLGFLKESGYLTFVLTNKPQDLAVKLLEAVFPGYAFDKIVGQSQSVKPKPDLTGFNLLLSEFNLAASEIMYIGDSDVDLITAAKAKVGAQVAVTYGFRSAAELATYLPQYSVDKPRSIIRLLRRQGAGKKMPELQFAAISALSAAVIAVLTFLSAHFFHGTVTAAAALTVGWSALGICLLFYGLTFLCERRLNRYCFMLLISAWLSADFWLFFYHEINIRFQKWRAAEPLVYLCGGLFFALIALLILFGAVIKLFHKLLSVRENRSMRHIRLKYLAPEDRHN